MATIDALDVFVRQQIYAEEYKNYQEEQSSYILEEIIALIILVMMKRGYDSFADMPKTELISLLSELNKKLTVKFGRFEHLTMAQMRSFFNATYSMDGALFKVLGGKAVKITKANKLWTGMLNAPAPGLGDEPRAVWRSFTKSMGNSIVKLVKQSYADKLSISATIKLITGTRAADFKDGLINKFGNQLNTTIRTFTQNIISFLKYEIGGLFFDRYQWVSVLDNRTTDICRHRDGNIYVYGKGPRPPAHYNCRSTIIPITVADDVKDMPTFYQWFGRQPVTVQNEIFGKRDADLFRAGKMSADSVGSFKTTKKLTLEQFKGKRNLILTTSEKSA